MYLEGYGVSRDIAQAVAWFEKAATAGDAIASFSLAALFDEGAAGLERDQARAAGWYRRAADLGLATAQHRLGVMYRDGRGVARDPRQALDWLRKASELGHPDAQLDLGALLLSVAPANRVEAHLWLNLAASRWKHEESRVRAATLRDELASRMTPAELSEAFRRATAWQDRHAWGR
jgi:TPR repeat protein